VINGKSVAVPIIAIEGAGDGPRVAITGGIHGAEYVAIEAARRVGMSIDPADVHGSLVVVPISNTTAYHARAIYTSALDGENLNRVFPGDPSGTGSQVLADWLFRTVIAPSQFYIDMHGGDMIEALVPFVLAPRYADPALDEAALAMAKASGIERVIHSDVSGSTCGAAAAAGIPAILAEVGGQGVWNEAEVGAHMESTMRVLRHLGVLPGDVRPVESQRIYDTFAWMRADVGGLFHPLVGVGDRVEQGQPVGTIVDYFGATLQELNAVESGEVGFLVTSLAMNVGDPVLAICA
jgi:predicted deacylase